MQRLHSLFFPPNTQVMHGEAWRARDITLYIVAAFAGVVLSVLLWRYMFPLGESEGPYLSLSLMQLFQYAILLLPLAVLLKVKKNTTHAVRIPARWPGWKQALGAPILAWLGLLAFLTLFVFLAGGDVPGVTGPKASVASIPQDIWTTLILVFVAGIVAPIVEEITFRGALLPAMLQHFRARTALCISAAAFAFAHTGQPGALVLLFTIGVTAGFLAWRTNSIIPAIVFHMLNNTVALLVDYFGGGLV